MKNALRAPMPYFGGKSRVAATVWSAFGRVQNYVEPFFGSGAVLLARPRETWADATGPGTETVNDRSAFLANFWRAVQADPDGVADACDWPVNETDLHARHRWLLAQVGDLAARLERDPTAFDARIAGWWCWGECAWIGTGWCDEQRGSGDPPQQLPHMGNAGRGIHRKLPHTGNAGRGVHSKGRRSQLRAYMSELATRLRGVRVACGDWSRVCSDTVTWRQGTTAVFLDPPYAEGAQQYAAGGTGTGLSAEVREWAIAAGERRDMRVILCGLDGEHEMPSTWRVVPWTAKGGYGSQRADKTNGNRHRERLWLSPHCLGSDAALPLFAPRPAAAPVADRPGVVRALPQEAQEQPAADAPAKPAKAPRKPRAPKEPKAAKAPRGTTAVYIPGETTDAKAGAA